LRDSEDTADRLAEGQAKRLATNFGLDPATGTDNAFFALAQTVKLGEEVGELHAEVLGALKYHRSDKAGKYRADTLGGGLADVMFCLALLAQILNVDLAQAVSAKIDHLSCELFPNKMPGTLSQELATAASLGVKPAAPGSAGFDAALNTGTIKWAVLQDGQLVVIPKFVNGVEISHAVLSGGEPVLAAGEADVAGSEDTGYFGLSINNHSGHFQPSAESLQIGSNAFSAAGIDFP